MNLRRVLILFSQWPCNLGSCNLLKTWSISYSTIFLQCAKVYLYTVAGWMDGWLADWLAGWMGEWMDGWMHRQV